MAARVLVAARCVPARHALAFAGGAGRARDVRYGELAGLVAGFALGVHEEGGRPGDRVVLLAAPSADFYALALAVLVSGMTLVLVDGRMAPGRIIGALHDADARMVIAPAALMRWWPAIAPLRRALRFGVDGALPGTRAVADLWRDGAPAPHPRTPPRDAPAIISFTSGSTGRAKGVMRTHAVLLAQHRALGACLPAADDDVHLTCLPAASLHGLCSGTTTVCCPPAGVAPAALHALIRERHVTSVSGGPAFVAALADAVCASGEPAVAVRGVAVGGAPVSRTLCRAVRRAFPVATGYVVYGATEAEPIATARLDAVEDAAGDGFLVGRPVAGVDVVLAAPDAPLPPNAAMLPGTVGEVAVRGARVTARRVGAPSGPAGWHRTGDLARVDGEGRLWLLGGTGTAVRHRGRVLYPYVVEAALLDDDVVRAAALVAHGRAREGEVAVALAPGADAGAALRRIRMRLDAMGLPGLRVRHVARIPMDARHGSKVRRAALARRLAWSWS